ncbi:ribbon-helix-helix domain-containing protein [Xanthomonas translucens]|uniref:Transcriptional regulator n=3 Tax=Xanthomonas campestris pv. translucens TaxID=343 RepID=A0A125PWF3_XANCT|nr:ribbon-helix-helix domain-containing protein [Xanthomonas translucens]KTF40510.1 transcriptional regulator [Xanthomonas translucens pv. translucens]KWV10693.1 transcriptional regulator [Xanthomonas translucens]KWV16251.1 transcriptional regulator [Xanthomonas translucens]MCC8446835.1 ribbon-helix-helix domain-containing protein [Xanthomonas translucens pv. translucens]MCS3358954.1 ribbon-helix-helix domain-containing protein [Xanthomonas translucens pv. translucens]
MSVRLNLTLSDDLNNAIDQATQESQQSKSEILREALQLHLAARDGTKQGRKIGLVNPDTRQLETEIIGL